MHWLSSPLVRCELKGLAPVCASGARGAGWGTMAMSVERSCTFLVHFDKAASQSEIKEALEGSDSAAKVQAMQKAIMMLLNGETLPALFITIVRYVLPSEDHTIQKLLLLYLVSLRCCSALERKVCCALCARGAPDACAALCRRRLRRRTRLASCCLRW